MGLIGTPHGTRVFVCRDVELAERLFIDSGANDQGLTVRERLGRLANGVLKSHQEKDEACTVYIKCWHPGLVGHSMEQILESPFDLDDARNTVAREHGFDGWEAAMDRGSIVPPREFEHCVDALVHGDIRSLERSLDERPELISQRSSFGHSSTLLHYVGSNGVETYRQKAPLNLPSIARLLLDRGAEVDAEANMYGGGCTTLALLTSSAHPESAGVLQETAQILIAAGAAHD